MKYILECEKIVESSLMDYIVVCVGDDRTSISKRIMDYMTPVDNEENKQIFKDGTFHAQEVYRRLAKTTSEERVDIFGNAGMLNVITQISVDEIERRLDEYKKKPLVGDCVTFKGTGRKGVILSEKTEGCFVWWQDGVSGFYTRDHLVKTGKNRPEIVEFYEKMKEDME